MKIRSIQYPMRAEEKKVILLLVCEVEVQNVTQCLYPDLIQHLAELDPSRTN